MNITDIKIKSKKWYEEHDNTLTASGLYSLFDNPIKFINEHDKIENDFGIGSPAYWGTQLEPIVFNIIKTWKGYENLKTSNYMFESEINSESYYYSVDGFDKDKIIEIKTTSSSKKYETVLDHYGFRQCLWYNILTGLPVHLFICHNNKVQLLGIIDENIQNYQKLKTTLISIMYLSNFLLKDNTKIDDEHDLINLIDKFTEWSTIVEEYVELDDEQIKANIDRLQIVKKEVSVLTKEKKELEKGIKDNWQEPIAYNGLSIKVVESIRKGVLNTVKLGKELSKIDIDINDYRRPNINIKALKITKLKK